MSEFQDISLDQLLERSKEREIVLVDVRSPQEFADGTIPGSVNIPLFDDTERGAIGTLYKQVSIQAAKEKGLEIVSRKLPNFIKQFESIPGHKAVFCWRGGMRSKTAATLTALMGMKVYRLSGGIRSYRRWVVDKLEGFQLKPRLVVINGYTGTGKTKLLRLMKERGYPVLDLEQLAGHRGSVFGQIGLKPNNQKTFDSLLLHELMQLNEQPYVLIEAESRRIGKAVLPSFIVEAKESGVQFFLQMPMEERVRNVLEDYDPYQQADSCMDAYKRIKNKIHTPIAAEIERCMQEGRYPEAVVLLLEHYYDPRYEHAIQQYTGERIEIRASNALEAAEQLAMHLRTVMA